MKRWLLSLFAGIVLILALSGCVSLNCTMTGECSERDRQIRDFWDRSELIDDLELVSLPAIATPIAECGSCWAGSTAPVLLERGFEGGYRASVFGVAGSSSHALWKIRRSAGLT